MTLQSLGDMARHFTSLRQNVEIRTRLNTLSNELSSGTSADVTARLGGDGARLGDLDRKLALDESYGRAATETAQLLETMQLSLGAVSDLRGQLAGQLVTATAAGATAAFEGAARSARAGFETVVRALNARIGEQSLFAGRATDGPALADPAEMMTDLTAAALAAGAVSGADLAAVVDTWFDDPAGGFATGGYLGDAGPDPVTRRVDGDATVPIAARADDPALREVMKAAALAALAGEPALNLGDVAAKDTLVLARDRLFSAALPLAQLQGRVGIAEASVEEVVARQSARKTVFTIMRNDMVSADPFSTATELQAVETQLQSYYMLTARLSRMTLSGFLR